MHQLARKHLESKMETTSYSFGGIYCLYTATYVDQPQSSPKSRFYRNPGLFDSFISCVSEG